MINNYLSVSLLAISILVLLLFVFIVSRVLARLGRLENLFSAAEKSQGRLELLLKDEMTRNREEAGQTAMLSRAETVGAINLFNDSVLSRMAEIAGLQRNQLDTFSSQLAALISSNEQKLDSMRETVEGRLRLLQEDNSRKLEQMRATVDERLHASLEKRLGESFKMVSERLELVHKGLGEMQTLASGVGDLKKVLTNVKTRGTWGEIQLGSLLEQILAPEQYDKNVVTKRGSSDRVEFAVKLPGRDGDAKVVWLPIDAKFPMEDYQRITAALEQSSRQAAEEAGKLLEARIKSEAKNIRDKYTNPPHTTDFAIMFLPVEGLYAEVLRRPGLCEILQREYRVVLTGPTTLAALLNSLQLGFRTLTIERRSSEVWALLGAVKIDFIKFGDLLEKTRKKLQEASNSIETAASKTRAIQKKLKKVQELPLEEDMDLP
jgi:DNA recombination protein RmuC